jgi:4-hydroxybenzoate polyprenyltransferase
VLTTHPLPALAVTAFGTATALSAGLGAKSVLLAAAIASGQASVGWSNDAIDAPRDIEARRADKPIARGEVSRRTVAAFAAGAVMLCVPLSLLLGWRAGIAHLVAVAGAWAYNLRLKRTVASPLPYALSFGLVPEIVALALPGSPAARWSLIVGAGCAGVAAHFANTVGDATEDELTGVRGLPQRIGPVRSVLVSAVFVAAAAGFVVVATGAAALPIAAAVVAVGVALALPLLLRRSSARHTAFGLVIAAVALLVVGFVVSGGARLAATPR